MFKDYDSGKIVKGITDKKTGIQTKEFWKPWANTCYSMTIMRISKTSHPKLKREVSNGKKGSRLRLCFRVVDDVPEKKGMDLWKQMSSSKCSFTCICGIFLPLNPSTTTVYARSAFYPGLCFTLSLQSAFYTQSAFYPWSAVCSPQSAVCVLHWPKLVLV